MKQYSVTFLLIGFSSLLYIVAAPRYYVGHFSDDARDILASKSLLQGSYNDLQTPGHPPLNFPLPGFPLFLAPFVALLKQHLYGLKGLPIAFCIGSTVLILRLWGDELSRPAVFILAALFAFNPTTVALSGRVISDSAFLFAVLSSLAFLKKDHGPWRDVGLCLAAGSAAFLRPEGVLLLAALAAALLWDRQWKPLLGIAGMGGLLAGLLVLNKMRTGSASGYLAILSPSLSILSQGLGALTRHEAALLKSLVLDLLLGVSLGPQTAVPLFLETTLIWGSLFLAGAGCLLWLKSSRTQEGFAFASSLYAFAHLWVHGIWLAVDPHYLWPLLPFLSFFILYRVDHLQASRVIAIGVKIVLVLVFCQYGWQGVFALRQAWDPPAENRLRQETFEWIRTHTAAESYVLAPQATALTLYTRRHSMALMSAADPDDFRARLLEGKVTHVMLSPARFLFVQTASERDPEAVWLRERKWVAADPAAYELVYRNDPEMVRLYGVKPAPEFQRAYALYRQVKESLMFQRNPKGSEILRALEPIIKLDPFPSALNAYAATALLSGGHLSLARSRLEKAVRIRPEFTMAWINLARVYNRSGDKTLALRALSRAKDTLGAGPGQTMAASLIEGERQQVNSESSQGKKR